MLLVEEAEVMLALHLDPPDRHPIAIWIHPIARNGRSKGAIAIVEHWLDHSAATSALRIAAVVADGEVVHPTTDCGGLIQRIPQLKLPVAVLPNTTGRWWCHPRAAATVGRFDETFWTVCCLEQDGHGTEGDGKYLD